MNYSELKSYPAYKESNIPFVGEVPEHWEILRLKNVCEVRLSNVDKKTEESEEKVRLCNYTDVYYHDQIDGAFDFMEASASTAQIRRFELCKNDVLITKDSETPDDIAVSALIREDLPGVLCGYHLGLLRPQSDSLRGPFLVRAINSKGINDQFCSRANGITRFAISSGDISDSYLPIPPLPEQDKIANFLDGATARIDALISQKRRLVELLKEKRQALITQAVTKGLDPKAKLKDSGVLWLGQVPEGWGVKRLKFLCCMQAGETITSDDIADEGDYPVYGGNGLRGFTHFFTHEGDFVLVGRQGALCGNVNIANGKFWASEHAVVVTPNLHVDYRWLGRVLDVMNLNQYSMSSAQPGIAVESIMPLWAPCPPIAEQVLIAEYINNIDKRITATQRSAESSIQKFVEYRQSLVFSAVSGKIDLRDWKAA